MQLSFALLDLQQGVIDCVGTNEAVHGNRFGLTHAVHAVLSNNV